MENNQYGRMQFNINNTIQVLERTPKVLYDMLYGLSEEWTGNNEGPDTWSPFDIVGHLIYGEKTDWITRMEIILSGRSDKIFEPFDRFAQFRESQGKNMRQLLDEFQTLREKNIQRLRTQTLTDDDLSRTGIHPTFGEVTLKQLLATWTAHDLNHIAQISRVMAKQYDVEVGPWKEFLGILK
ncbi:hypothetical protein C900_05654 [Fulvivirga imtechensis AK7]|uniref:DinB-like domain-containing protein n=1 Tax=Fulvivirga imtechensis AK7 TaxID=1237149 RepID=L8JJ79_9BACT|nr:DinB family protein [Fulvivirga imtechensis]ELR68961.1 hypothetical protein C900_05654 [Fulvivirga imtechensis AK7]